MNGDNSTAISPVFPRLVVLAPKLEDKRQAVLPPCQPAVPTPASVRLFEVSDRTETVRRIASPHPLAIRRLFSIPVTSEVAL